MTVVVYGLVAGIVKLDDGGLYLSRKGGGQLRHKIQRRIGETILKAAPYLMKGLSIAGTAAMFMVGGGILTHGTPGAHELIHHLAQGAGTVPGIGLLEVAMPTLLDALTGLLAGAAILAGALLAGRVFRTLKEPS
jgi:hypothetical protein